MRSSLRLSVVLLLAFCFAWHFGADVALAQENVGQIVGVVRDPSEAAVPGATVTVQHVASGATRETHTNSSGGYTLPTLMIGEYNIKVAAPGFQTSEQKNIRVVAGVTVTLNFNLRVGDVTQTVEVTAEAPKVDTASSGAGTSVETEMVASLPLFLGGGWRSIQSFLGTQSTVNAEGSPAGIPSGSFAITYDGVMGAMSPNGVSGDFITPGPESVSEVRLNVNQASAEYGTTYGSSFTVVMKSGTNDLHGTLYHYLRNNRLDAKPFFADAASPQKQNEWGVVLGGPLVIPKIYNGKNKTFFFGTLVGYRFRTSTAGTSATVPTQKMRGGDFSEFLGAQLPNPDALGRPIFAGQIYDPMTTRSDGKGGFIRNPFPGNIIPSGRISSISKAFQDGYPLPTQGGTQLNWYGLFGRNITNQDKYMGKVDHRFNDNHTFSFSWEESGIVIESPAGPAFDRTIAGGFLIDWASYRGRFNYAWIMRPNLIFGLRGSANRLNQFLSRYDEAREFGAQAGIKGVFTGETPAVSIQGVTGFGHPFGARGLVIPQMMIPVNTDLTWVKGSHNIKFGASYIHGYTGKDFNISTGGGFNFSARETGLPGLPSTGQGYASYLLGEVSSAGLGGPNAGRFRSHTLGFYGQDSWRVNRKLTVNYGLRWDLYLPMWEGLDRISSFDATVPNPRANNILGGLTFWGEGAGRNGRQGMWQTYTKAISPNLGFAYSLTPRTVIRASYGLAYSTLYGGMTAGLRTPNQGFGGSIGVSTLDNGVTPAFNWANGFPIERFPSLPNTNPGVVNGSSVQLISYTSIRPARVQNLNFGIEREAVGGIVFRANYIGRLTDGLPAEQLIQWDHLPLQHLSKGSLLLANINSAEAIAAGIPKPYPTFNGPVAQALRPYPQFNGIQEYMTPAGVSTYHGLNLEAQKRMGQGLTFLVSYTASKYISNIGSFQGQGSESALGRTIQHTDHRKLAKGLMTFGDIPQKLVISYVYELPFGPGKRYLRTTNAVVRHLVGGWSLSGINTYQSATPITIGTTQSNPGGLGPVWAIRNEGVPIRTNVSCDGYKPGDRYLDIGAFATPAAYTLGNTSTLSNVRPCGSLNESLAVLKNFPFTEAVRLQAGLSIQNLFNRHQWTGLSTNIGFPESFGRYSGASGPRQAQVHLKLEF